MNTHPEYQYLNLLQEVLEKGFRKVDRGTGDASYSLFGKQMRFDLSKGFPLLTTKKVYWKGVLYELFWFLKGMTNIRYLIENNVHIWDDYPYKIYVEKNSKLKIQNLKIKIKSQKLLSKEEFVEKLKTDAEFAKEWGELPRIYGEMWRKWPSSAKTQAGKPKRTIDQLAWLIQEIKDDPNAHNLIVSSWNPEYLYGMAIPDEASRFPICHNMYQVNIIDGKLSLHLYQRSADLFLGVPFNIASYALLTHILSRVTGYEPGEFIHTFGDVHIYELHLEQVKEQKKRKPKRFPNIRFLKEFKSIDECEPDYIKLEDYNPYPPIKAALSVSGGLYQKKHE